MFSPRPPRYFQHRVAIVSLLISVPFIVRNWVVAIVRFAYAVRDLTAADRPWIAAETFLWSIIEVNTGLICACVPVLKPFFRQIVPKAATDRSWPFGKRKFSWTGEVLKDEGKHTHRSQIEMDHEKGRSEDSSTRSLTGPSTPDSASNGTGALGSEK